MNEKTINKIPNVPNLRFNEDGDDWKLIKINSLLKFQNGINASPEKYGKGIKYISVSDILNNKFITNKNIKGLIDIDDKTFKNFEVSYGDILFQRSSETIEDIGRTNVYLDENTNSTFGGFVIRGKKIGHYNPIFFKYLLDSPTARKSIIRMGAGAQHYNISQEGLDKIKLHFPNDLIQEKIASLFMLIDNCIETQSKIIDKLKSLLNKISHHYFDNLSGTEIALSEIADIYQPKTISQADCVENGRYNVFGANGIIGKFNKYNHELPQICITCRGSTSGNVFITEERSWITGNAMVINIDNCMNRVNKTFLYYYLSSINFNNIISGSGQPQIVRNPLMRIRIILPPIHEQLRFEKIIKAFANKLEKEKDILSLYKKQKAYLLQNMFI